MSSPSNSTPTAPNFWPARLSSLEDGNTDRHSAGATPRARENTEQRVGSHALSPSARDRAPDHIYNNAKDKKVSTSPERPFSPTTNIRFPRSCRFQRCAAPEEFTGHPRRGSKEFAAGVVGKCKLKNLMGMISVFYGGTSSRFIPTNILISPASLVFRAHVSPIRLARPGYRRPKRRLHL
jgi:hypothetical protein